MFITIILIVSAIIRVLAFGKSELWYDEAFTGMLTYANSNEFWKVIANEQTPPVYYFLIKTWSFIFGHNDFALRSFSLISGLLTIYLLYKVAQKFFDQKTAYIVAILATFNPFLIEYSMEARTYALYGFFVLLSFYALLSKRNLLFLISISVLSLLHFVAIFYAIILIVFYLYFSYKDKQIRKAVGISLIVLLLYTGVVSYAIAKIYQNTQTGWIPKAVPSNITRSIAAYTYGVKSKNLGIDEVNKTNLLGLSGYQLGGYVTTFLIIGLTAVLYYIYDQKNKILLEKLLLILSLYLGPQIGLILLSTFTKYNIYVERYLFPSSLFFVLLCAILVAQNFRFRYALIPVGLYVLTTFFITNPNYYTGMRDLSSKYREYDGEVVFTSPIDYTVGRYYFRNADNVRLLDPRDPGNTYKVWSFIREDYSPQNLETAVLISPDEDRIPAVYGLVEEVGDYSVYKRGMVE